MSTIVFEPIEFKPDAGLFVNGKIHKLENDQKKPIYEKSDWIFEQYPNTPSEEFTSENEGNYISISVYDQESCKQLEKMFDHYDDELRNQIQNVIGEYHDLYMVTNTLKYPVPKLGTKPDPTKTAKPKIKKAAISIEAKNVIYYEDKVLDKTNMKIYYDTRKGVYSSTQNMDKRKAGYAKLVYPFKFPDETTKVMTERMVPASELDEKKEFHELVVKHRSVNSISEGTKKPNECTSVQELEQIYGKPEEKVVKNYIELKKLMGFNGYRRYVFYPKETQAKSSPENNGNKTALKIKWYVGCIDIIQVKGNFTENRKKSYDDMLSDYTGNSGSSEEVSTTSTYASVLTQPKKQPVVQKVVEVEEEESGEEEEDDEEEEVVVTPPPKPAPKKVQPAPVPVPPPTPSAKKPTSTKPVKKPVVQVEESEDEDDTE